MLVIAAVVMVKKGKGEEFEKGFRPLRAKVLKDPGAIAYVLHRSVDDPCKYLFYEKYENEEAFKYHTSTEHFKAFFKKMEPVMQGPPEITHYQEVV
jgi:quinol monooxygenase YgiN